MDTWEMVAAERTELADVMDTFGEAEWATPSLCEGWTVRVVAGHLVGWFQRSLPTMLLKVLRTRSFDDTVEFFSQRDALLPVDQLVTSLRVNAGNRFTPPLAPPEMALTEVLVHGLDIRHPLGLSANRPGDRSNRVLEFLTTKEARRAMMPRDRLSGLAISTTDTEWTHGHGAEVTGPAASVVLALLGRPHGLQGLDGAGAGILRDRVTS
jgi:uncharacterized protein (TIGR03083 family)